LGPVPGNGKEAFLISPFISYVDLTSAVTPRLPDVGIYYLPGNSSLGALLSPVKEGKVKLKGSFPPNIILYRDDSSIQNEGTLLPYFHSSLVLYFTP
jgi:hypothetical protein